MKKILMGMAILGAMLGVAVRPAGEAQAACAADWAMGDRKVSFCGGALEDGTFMAKLEGDFEKGFVSTVILKDYKGQAFYLEASGTGFPVNRYVIELNGDNELTVLPGREEMMFGGVSYELTGEGRVLVRTEKGTECVGAGGPREEWPDDALIGPTEEQATGHSSSKIGWIIGGVVVGVYIVGSLIAFVVIGVRGHRRKAAEKAAENIVKNVAEKATARERF